MPLEVRMFWAKRLKEADADADGAWLLSYSDLMTLLLCVFVMIAAMSELRAGDHFGRVRDGVRRAFGFSGMTPAAPRAGAKALRRPPTLLDRLETAGFKRQSSSQLIGPDDEVLAACDVIVAPDSVTVRLAGHELFAPHSAALSAVGTRAVGRIAEFLADGTSRIEVRGFAENSPLPAHVPFRDAMDLSYARTRAVTDVLAARGVEHRRVFISARGEDDPGLGERTGDEKAAGSGLRQLAAATTAPEALPDGASRRIEIIVHAASTGGHSAVNRREGQE